MSPVNKRMKRIVYIYIHAYTKWGKDYYHIGEGVREGGGQKTAVRNVECVLTAVAMVIARLPAFMKTYIYNIYFREMRRPIHGK